MTATHPDHGRTEVERAGGDLALRFGADGELVGIVSLPDRHALRPPTGGGALPAVVLLNAGVLHRVGPHRLHVVLGRALAARGLAALRLDLGGIGDSVATTAAGTFRDSAVADTRAALGGLADRLGSSRFALFGICAGADNALATALVDDRVTAIVLVDPHAYATRRSQLRELRSRLTAIAAAGGPRAVVRFGLDKLRDRARTAWRERGRPAPPAEGREPPPVAEMAQQLAAVVDRGVRVLAVFSGIHGARYNHTDQLFEVFPALRGRVDVAYFAGANHTFTELAAQAALIETATAWLAALPA